MNTRVATSQQPKIAASPPDGVPRKIGVRPARAGDEAQILEMMRALHAEGSYRDLPIHEAKLRSFLAFIMQDREHACLVYEDRAGNLTGFMVGYVTTPFFTLEKTAADICLFVRPEQRGSLIAYRIWSAFRDWAARADARILNFGTVAGIAPERARRFFTGLGMTEVGSLYALKLR